MKKLTVPLMIISLMVSVIFNISQYKTINNYKQKQYLIDTQVKSSLAFLENYIVKIDFKDFDEENLRMCLWMSNTLFTLVSNSSYRYNGNYYVVECFNNLNNLFVSAPLSKIKSHGDQLKVMLQSIINTSNNEINPDNCRKLSRFIRSF